MNMLRRLVIVQAAIVLAILVAVFALPESAGIVIITTILFLEPIADGLALIYLVRLYRTDVESPRSWLLAFLVTAAAEVFLGLTPIALLTLRRLFGFAPLPTPLNTAAIAFALVFIGAVPIMEVALFHLIRSSRTGDPRNQP